MKNEILDYIHKKTMKPKVNDEQKQKMFKKFGTVKPNLSSAFNDPEVKDAMNKIRQDKRTIPDDHHLRVWNKDWRK